MSRLLAGAAGVVVLAAVIVGGILLARDDGPPSDYDARTEDDFMTTCTADAEAEGLESADDFCRCAYDRLQEEVPYAQFLEMEAALQANPEVVPAAIGQIRTACLQELATGTAPTTAPTTTAPA